MVFNCPIIAGLVAAHLAQRRVGYMVICNGEINMG